MLEKNTKNQESTISPLTVVDISKSVEKYKKKLDLNNSWHRERLKGVIEFISTCCNKEQENKEIIIVKS